MGDDWQRKMISEALLRFLISILRVSHIDACALMDGQQRNDEVCRQIPSTKGVIKQRYSNGGARARSSPLDNVKWPTEDTETKNSFFLILARIFFNVLFST